jgi:hypothetical protein
LYMILKFRRTALINFGLIVQLIATTASLIANIYKENITILIMININNITYNVFVEKIFSIYFTEIADNTSIALTSIIFTVLSVPVGFAGSYFAAILP